MALVYCAGKKWSRLHFLTHSRKRWLLIWGCLGLLETLTITGLLWARDIPKFVPNFPGWAGVAASSVYYALHFYNRSVVFALGFLFAAIGETAIGVAFAVLVWWVFHIHPEPAETFSGLLSAVRFAVVVLSRKFSTAAIVKLRFWWISFPAQWRRRHFRPRFLVKL
jgi:hypothetical protein